MQIKGYVDLEIVNVRSGEKHNIPMDNLVFNEGRQWMVLGGGGTYGAVAGICNYADYTNCKIYLSSSTSIPTRDDKGTVQSSIYSYSPDLASSPTTQIDDFTLEYLFSHGPFIGGSQTLRVIGLRHVHYLCTTISTAVVLPIPILHTADIYIYVYYRVRITLDPTDYMYNIRDISRNHSLAEYSYRSSVGCYRKYWILNPTNDVENIIVFDGRYSDVLGTRGAQSVAKATTLLMAGRYESSNLSLGTFTNGYKPTKSRVFGHLSAVSNSIFFDSNSSDIPESFGTLTLDAANEDQNTMYYPFAVKLNYADDGGSGSIGDISYNLDYYYCNTGPSFSSGSYKSSSIVTQGTIGIESYKGQTAVSCNREFATSVCAYGYEPCDFLMQLVYYKGAKRDLGVIPVSYVPKEQTLCTLNNGTAIWAVSTTGMRGTICRLSNIDDLLINLSTDIDTYNLDDDFSGASLLIYHMFCDQDFIWILTNLGLIKILDWSSGTPDYIVYNSTDLGISDADFVPREGTMFWSFQVRNGVVLWLKNSDKRTLVYWDSSAGSAVTYTESSGWSTQLGDILLSFDGRYVGYTNNIETYGYPDTQTQARIREPIIGSWAIRSDQTTPWDPEQRARLGTDINSIFIYWGKNYTSQGYILIYLINTLNWDYTLLRQMSAGSYYYYYLRHSPDRSMTLGSPYLSYNGGKVGSFVSENISTKVHYGWDGADWVINHTGNKVTHSAARYIPHNVSLAFNDAVPPLISFRVEDYYAFYVHPHGWIVDNLEELSVYDTIYCWSSHLEVDEPHMVPAGGGTITFDKTTDLKYYSTDASIYCGSYAVRLQSDPTVEFTRVFLIGDLANHKYLVNTGGMQFHTSDGLVDVLVDYLWLGYEW